MKISFIKHSELSDVLLSKIINLKQQHWDYSIKQNKDWIEKNLVGEDYHLLFSDKNNNLIAYLNLINISIIDENKHKKIGLGIGNVCVDFTKEKKGLGLLLMQVANYYIKNKEMQGLLLCKNDLVVFYKKAGWEVFKGEFFVNEEKIQGVLMYLFPLTEKFLFVNKNF